jgi:hypothetical protein
MRVFLSIILTLGLLISMPITVAVASSRYTEVSGVVVYNHHRVGRGVLVTVTCDKKIQTVNTNRRGQYSVKFTGRQCRKDSKVTVSASYNGATDTLSRRIRSCNNRINLELVGVSNVPEFGALTATGATILGTCAFLIIRRRQLSATE